MTPFIETFAGERFQPLTPTLDSIWIEDIAHALGNQCRFTGHTREFYSVAEHSVRVSWLLEEWGDDDAVQFWGLMHDASEAYLGDWSTPLKQSDAGTEYRAAERRLMRAICDRFSMSPTEPEAVRLADAVMLATEARDLMPNKPQHWAALMVRPHHERIAAWSPKEAKQQFLYRFHDLDGRR
jgi:5'-deoxynucleotidase YfbR-like HD superfamily hydrolase